MLTLEWFENVYTIDLFDVMELPSFDRQMTKVLELMMKKKRDVELDQWYFTLLFGWRMWITIEDDRSITIIAAIREFVKINIGFLNRIGWHWT